MKWKLNFLLLLLFSSNLTPVPASADSANPPKIISVVQITKGPYKPGDVISFQVNTTGGNPGLEAVVLRAECINQFNTGDIRWERGLSNNTIDYFGFFQHLNPLTAGNQSLVSAIISSRCTDGVHKVSEVTVVDQTRLNVNYGNDRDSNLFYTVTGGLMVPPGVVRPEPKPDTIDLSILPNEVMFVGVPQDFVLPRTSQGGQILNWLAHGHCKVTIPFIGDIGGNLSIDGPGTCTLEVVLPNNVDLFQSPKFLGALKFVKNNNADFPQEATFRIIDKAVADKAIAAKAAVDARIASARVKFSELSLEIDKLIKKYPSQKTYLLQYKKKVALFEIVDERNILTAEGNLTSISLKINSIKVTLIKTAKAIKCVQGKKTIKVVDVNPKCPSGYKKK